MQELAFYQSASVGKAVCPTLYACCGILLCPLSCGSNNGSDQREVLALAQLYRDRADAENNFDELKNQWGWGGFTTQDLARCGIMARMVALVYNWWTLFVRLAHPHKHFEAISCRPLLLHGVATQTRHAGQTRLSWAGRW